MPHDSLPFLKSLNHWLSAQQLNTISPPHIETLAGDGSSRTFFRVRCKKSFVLLYDKEWVSSRDYPAHQSYLREKGLPVPEFLYCDPNSGILLMEDLGDQLLQNEVQAHPSAKMSLLVRAAELLADFHGKTFPPPPELPGSQRSFDETKLSQELNYTLEHLEKNLLQLSPFESAQNVLRGFSRKIEAYRPLVFCHRDYHTRNILFFENELRLIDFQDARLGPPEYDLASLIYDPYLDLKEAERTQLVSAYREKVATHPKLSQSWTFSSESLRTTGLQRVIKAAGSYAAFFNLQKKTTHLKYLEPALRIAGELRKGLTANFIDDFDRAFDLEKWSRKWASHGK